jgi:hypothetical protein
MLRKNLTRTILQIGTRLCHREGMAESAAQIKRMDGAAGTSHVEEKFKEKGQDLSRKSIRPRGIFIL